MARSTIRLNLLGAPVLATSAGSEPFAPERTYQLLAYLGCRHDWVTRDALAALLWPEHDQASARRNLRKILFRAARLPWLDALESRTDSVRWLVDTDLHSFEAAIGRADWPAAVALYRGGLLDGCEHNASEPFVQWLLFERRRVASLLREAMLGWLAASAHEPAAQAQLAMRWLAMEPLEEDAVAAAIRARLALGQHAEAKRCYRGFTERLAEQLGIEASASLRELAHSIEAGRSVSATAHAAAPPSAGLLVARRV